MNFIHTKYDFAEDLEVNNVQIIRSIKSFLKEWDNGQVN